MRKWTKTDIFLTVCTILFSILLARLAAGFYAGRTDTPHYLDFLVLIPLVFAALLGWFLKKRGRRLRFLAGLLVGFDGLLLAGSIRFDVTLKIIRTLTGYNNGETLGFALLIPLLCGCGLLIGVGLGALLARLRKEG